MSPALSISWPTSGRMRKALEDLALRSTDTTKALPSELPPLREQLREGTMQGRRMALDPDFPWSRMPARQPKRRR